MTDWVGLIEPAVIYFDDQRLTVPEPHATLLGLAVLACLAILRRWSTGTPH